jgi:HNH endonuclease
VFKMGGRQWIAARASYTLFVGPIPEGLETDHTCKNNQCVNHAHLEAVSRAENGRRERLTTCKNGHDLTDPANLVNGGVGRTKCRRCHADRQARYGREKRARSR